MKLFKIISLLTLSFDSVFGSGWSFKGFHPVDLSIDRNCDHHAKAYLGKAFQDIETDHRREGHDKELGKVPK